MNAGSVFLRFGWRPLPGVTWAGLGDLPALGLGPGEPDGLRGLCIPWANVLEVRLGFSDALMFSPSTEQSLLSSKSSELESFSLDSSTEGFD